MIPNETLQTLNTVGQGVRIVGNFKITDATQARILVSLSDKMYTRKELAFVREYSTNAADAHIVAKKPISEIKVQLPTIDDLNFRIRDFGSGLSEEQIATVYCVFGESTKRNSNEQNGLLGYGCKAGFAHADSFTVTSWYNGEKSIYQCVKGDSSKLHSAMLLSRCPSDEPSGIEVTVPVKQSSLWTVHREAADFYKYWPEIPTISNMADDDFSRMNMFRTLPATLKGDGWEVRPKSAASATAIAYMGWVAYNIDWNILYNRLALTSESRVMFELLKSNDVTLLFKMGEVQFVDSREHLEYTDMTLEALTKKIEGIFEKIKDAFQDVFTSATNLWEAKKLYGAVFGYNTTTSDELDDDDKDITIERIKVLDGDLAKVENIFKESFTWNGIQIYSHSFKFLNKFDNMHPMDVLTDVHVPSSPVLSTYRRKNKRVKTCRCTADKNNCITAMDAAIVVINDTERKTGMSMVARYLIFGLGGNTRKVHFLTFDNDTIRNNFYTHFNFDTVPTLKMSELLPAAKAWTAINKVSRNYRGGSGGVRVMRYLDVDSQAVLENDVPIREMEEGGYFIETGEGRKECRMVMAQNGYSALDPSDVVTSLWVLKEKAGLDIDKVYIVNKQTKKAKWFQQAVASGEWKSVWAYLDECELDIDPVAVIDADAFDDNTILCDKAAAKLNGKITATNSLMNQILSIVTAKNFTENSELAKALRKLMLWDKVIGDQKGSVDFKTIKQQMSIQYPMLEHYSHVMTYGEDRYLTPFVMEKLIRYINAMDLYVELAEPTAVPTKEEVAA